MAVPPGGTFWFAVSTSMTAMYDTTPWRVADWADVDREAADEVEAAVAGVLLLAGEPVAVPDVVVADVAVPDVAVLDVAVLDVEVPDVAVGAGVDPAPDVDAASVSAGARRTSATVPENERAPIDSISKRT